jgi:hypothetical protein
MSHIAALTADRLTQATTADELAAVKTMLQEIQKAGYQAFLHHGGEADYEKIGQKVAKRYRTPAGKWRKPKNG